jgi:hypothetical protein
MRDGSESSIFTSQGPAAVMEVLEARQLLSSNVLLPQRLTRTTPSLPSNVNISRMAGNQSEGAIAINPTNPSHVFALSNIDVGDGLLSAVSNDGGHTWSKKLIATGRDNLPPACCDPSAVFDEFGNLFIGYINSDTNQVEVGESTDGGSTFQIIGRWNGDVDQPTVTAGKAEVWVTFGKSDLIYAAGAKVNGLGNVASFGSLARVPGPVGSNFGDIAIGSQGQVMVTYESPVGDSGPAKLYVSVDPDGLGSKAFTPAVKVVSTNVGGFKKIPAQSVGEIDAEVGLAWDRSGGVANGRVYMVYTNSSAIYKNYTVIMLTWSSDNGAHWSTPVRVNKDASRNSHFLPRIALDQTTGHIALSWYDARNDNGHAPGSTNSRVNDDAQLWGVLASPTSTGVKFSGNFQISAGTSNADRADNSIDYGDYHGLAFYNGQMMPIWADDSNSTKNNPDGRLFSFDMYTAQITDTLA